MSLDASGIGIVYLTQLVLKLNSDLVTWYLSASKSIPNPMEPIETPCDALAQKVNASYSVRLRPAPSTLKIAPA